MSFFEKLFGKKPDPSEPRLLKPSGPPVLKPPLPSAAPADPARDPNLIRVHDGYGREFFLTKQQWRDSILPGQLKKVWNDPEGLYQTILGALSDGLAADMLEPARQLAKLQPGSERGAVMLAIVHRELKQTDDAEKALQEFIRRHGETGAVLVNLAKIHADRGQEEKVIDTLWRALELDPNLDNGVAWYEAIHRKKSGTTGSLDALRQIAGLPGAWRARLWLAHAALVSRDLPTALALYNDALSIAPRPVPATLLQQISGDLGTQGHLPEILQLVSPLFDVTQHGIEVGNNLIKANLDLGQLDAMRALLDQHYAQKRPDWKDALAFWDSELMKARVGVAAAHSKREPVLSLLSADGPVWLPENSPAAELFPAPVVSPLRIAFLGSTAEKVAPAKPSHEMADAAGRLSRSIPLFLAEQVRFRAQVNVRTLVSWLKGTDSAFVVTTEPWDAAQAAGYARAGEHPCDYAVVTHLKALGPTWALELRLLRTLDAKCLATIAVPFPPAEPQTAVPALADRLLQLLEQHAEVTRAIPPPLYEIPGGAFIPNYLLRLEQLYATRCGGMPGVSKDFLGGEREILDGNLQLCLNHPRNTVTRLLLFETVSRMKKFLPQVVDEFRDKLLLLQKEKPLPEPAQSIAQRILSDVLV